MRREQPPARERAAAARILATLHPSRQCCYPGSGLSMVTVQLSHLDAKLTYLALRYHLARPGSELDPETKQIAPHGLAEVAQALEPQLEQAVATIELSEHQQQRLLSAIGGTMNQLKAYPLLTPLPPDRAGGRDASMADFEAALRRLFPEVAEEREEAPQLAMHLLTLRRRLQRVASTSSPAEQPSGRTKGRWWRFRDRTGA